MINTILEGINDRKTSISNGESTGNFELPVFLSNNLKHNLRKYQIEAFENFILLNNKENKIDSILKKYNSKNNHHLFHMATGSGKTMIMAGTIIYFYSLGYRKFIFTSNQTNLIDKTKTNLLYNVNSNKCEFKNKQIEINSKKINIIEVDETKTFSSNNSDIEIMFTTIHNLHNKITDKKENSINLDDIKNEKIIILADEAHHFQTNTKSKTILDDNKSWEDTIQSLLNINSENKLIEFTATMDLLNDNVLEKYKDKIIYDYTLKSFRDDGYSKEVSLIQNNNKEDRILQSIIINQYRYEIGILNKINVTSKILFKSNGTILDLEKEKDDILLLIKNLDLNKLNEICLNSNLKILNKLNVFLDTNEKKESFISLIKKQFNDNNCLIIHSKDINKKEKLSIANNLDKNNNIRMIFAIDMLNEGWDVLSLFDIVKLDEIVVSNIKKTTTSEIQLIGRGARIFPFIYVNEFNQELDKYKRKFDDNIDNDLRILEDMYFYSANDNDYINKIKIELIQIGLKSENDEKQKTLIKVQLDNDLNIFAKDLLNKFVFTNSLEKKYNNNNLISDFDINIQITKDYLIKENHINDNKLINNDTIFYFTLKEFINNDNLFILNNIVNNYSYFNINNIANKFNINSKKELINDILNLNNKVSITIKNKDISLLTFIEKSSIIKEMLNELEKQLERKIGIKIGSKKFNTKYSIKDTFVDYYKNESNVKNYNEKLNYNIQINNNTKDFEINNKKLFYYDRISFDSGLELEMYNLFDKSLDINNFLVIRNEIGFKMYNPFTEYNENEKYSTTEQNIFEVNGNGFEPDFIVLKKGTENKIFQYFIEVKGEHILDNKSNEWKEHLLSEINKEEVIIEDNVEYKIYGIPFFTENNIENDVKKNEYINKIKG